MQYKKIVIGIDQSYKNCGISISADGRLLKVKSLKLSNLKTHTQQRKELGRVLKKLLNNLSKKSNDITCIVERIRLSSKGFLNIDYIKSIGALNSVIIDVCNEYNIKVYSADTRCWKSQVVGSSKKAKNKYGVPEEKWLTVKWCISKGFESSILKEVKGRKEKGTFVRKGVRYEYDNDAADSAAISMFGFIGDTSKLKEEK